MAFDGSTLLVMGAAPAAGIGVYVYRVNPMTGATVLWRQVHGTGLIADAKHVAWMSSFGFVIIWSENDPNVSWEQQARGDPDTVRGPLGLASCGILWYGYSSTLYLSYFGSNNPIPLTAITTGPEIKAIADGTTVYWTDGSGAIGKIEL